MDDVTHWNASDGRNYEQLAIELLVALRGRRSRRAFSTKLGYKSNMVQRWETGVCQPKAGMCLAAFERSLKRGLGSAYFQLYQRRAPWGKNTTPRAALVQFLTELRGKKPILEIAAACKKNRFTVSRWLKGQAEPTLAEFLQLVDVMSNRLLDFLSAFTNPEQLPSVALAWRQLEQARILTYQDPWGHAVLRALRLEACSTVSPETWIANRLSLDATQVRGHLEQLQRIGAVYWNERRWVSSSPVRVDTGKDPRLSRYLKEHWTSVALERIHSHSPGSFGYSLFEISKNDLSKLKEVHLNYVKELQRIVANSKATDRIGLYCAQLFDLSNVDNTFAADPSDASQ